MAHLAAPANDDVGPGAVLTGVGTFVLSVSTVLTYTGPIDPLAVPTGIPTFGGGAPPATTAVGFVA